MDQREDYFGSTFSRAKYAAARRRISFSCSSSRLRRRSSASSFFSLLPPLPSGTSSARSQFLRHDSLIPRSLAILAIGASPVRASSTARCRNSGGVGRGHDGHPSRWPVATSGGVSRQRGEAQSGAARRLGGRSRNATVPAEV